MDEAETYASLIHFLHSYGTVLTEHVGNETLLQKEISLTEKDIYSRDMQWLHQADLLIAEVSTPSLGVGYELAAAEQLKIPCLCLFCRRHDTRLSAMIGGNPFFQILEYNNLEDAFISLSTYLDNSKNSTESH